MSTSTKKRTVCANQLPRPMLDEPHRDAILIGAAIAEVSATISWCRGSRSTPPMPELPKNVLPVGSVVKKLGLHEPRPLRSR